MTSKPHTTRIAGSAFVAALALTSTSALAQAVPDTTSAPPVVAPAAPPVAAPPPVSAAPQPAAPVAAPAPTVVVPDVAPPLAEPVVQPIPAAEPEPAPAATPSRAESPPTAREQRVAPREAPAAAQAAPEPAPVAETETPPPPALANEPAAPMPDTTTSEAAAPSPSAETSIGLIAGLLSALGVVALAIWGFVAIGRRRPTRAAAVPVVERPVVERPEPLPQPLPEPPLAASANSVTPLATPRPATGSSLAHAGAAVSLPRELPGAFADREELFWRMVDAAPDRANPFTHRKARMKRARLILQSLGRDFGDAEPWIDLSQYPQNWPELARRNRAAA